VLKRVLGTDLVSALRTVGAGGSLLDPRTTTALMNRIRRERERQDPLAELHLQRRTQAAVLATQLHKQQPPEG
jgi:two-component system, NarL family, response regulator DevR